MWLMISKKQINGEKTFWMNVQCQTIKNEKSSEKEQVRREKKSLHLHEQNHVEKVLVKMH